MARITNRIIGFLQRREVILIAFLAYTGLLTALKWQDPALAEVSRTGQIMSLGIYALLSVFVLRNNTVAIWVMAASILYAGLTSLFNSLALSLTDPFNTLGKNALSLVAGTYFTMSAAVIFRSRKRRVKPGMARPVVKDGGFIDVTPVGKDAPEKKDGEER
jgi:hypothetical protein